MIDYQAINESITPTVIMSILEKLNIPYKNMGTHLIMPTVCHNPIDSEASWKLYYYFNYKLFVCYTECGNMTIWKFLKHFYEAQGLDFEWYQDIYLLITDTANYKKPEGFTTNKYHSLKEIYGQKQKLITLPEYDSHVLECFEKIYPIEWLNDGISKEAMDKFNILYSISQNKIIIPHLDETGRLIGIRGRALNEWEIENLGKYMPIQIEGTWYKHPLSMNLYGLYENQKNIQDTGIVFIAESEKAVLQAESFNRKNCFVAVCGSHFNKFTLQKLMSVCSPKEIVICFDKEEEPGQDKYFNRLYSMCENYKNYANFSFLYDRENLLNLKDSPTDKGEAIFEKLLSKKVVVR